MATSLLGVDRSTSRTSAALTGIGLLELHQVPGTTDDHQFGPWQRGSHLLGMFGVVRLSAEPHATKVGTFASTDRPPVSVVHPRACRNRPSW